MTSICPPILKSSYGTLHEEASQCTSFFMFLCQKTKKPKKKKQKPKNICKKVDQKPERVVYPKGEPKEREREKM